MPARRSTSVRRAVLAVAVPALLVSACSNTEASVNKAPHTGAGTASPVDGVQQITITTGVDLRFHPSTFTVHPGQVRIILVNKVAPTGGPPHNLQITGLPAGSVPLIQPGQTSMVTFTAPAPGRYRFVCTIHIAQGQTGTMIVAAGAAGSS